MIKLYKGDCLIESDKIESGSVDLILTDLPYGTVKDLYKNTSWDVVIETEKVMDVANRILRKNGKMILFCQEPFTSELKSKAPANLSFNQRLIWEKDSSGNMLFAKKACVNFYEDILVFSKTHEFQGLHPLRHYFEGVFDYVGLSKSKIIEVVGQKADHCLRFKSSQFGLCTEETYQSLVVEFRLDSMNDFVSYKELKKVDDKFKSGLSSTFNLWDGKKYKSNILKHKKDYSGFHPTQKPTLLMEDLVKTYSNEGDLVVDLTMGSGSTGVACKNTGRRFTGIEMDKDYFSISKERIMGKT